MQARALLLAFGAVCVLSTPLAAQDQASAPENPLAILKTDLTRVLAAASIPFTPDQEREVTFMMEERLRASESLFGGLMDFRSGPTGGQNAEQLQSAIGWLRGEFLTRVREHLTPAQLLVWEAFQASALVPAADARRGQPPPQQTQYIPINNNRFTAEDLDYQGGGGTTSGGAPVVIQRGGGGSWHGNAQYFFRDDALNARNVFASNKPPYQERRFTSDVSGPLIPGRLTTNVSVGYGLAQNVDTINATLPDGPYALGITRPSTNHSIGTRNTFQFSSGHSLSVNTNYQPQHFKNEGIGGFTLIERGSNRDTSQWNVDLRQFSALGAGHILEGRLNISSFESKVVPFNDAVRINVSDTFNSGGAQNRSDEERRTYDFSTLYTRPGQTLTVKAGMQGAYRSNRSFSQSNFGGTYTFPSLEDYLAGTANTYRVAQGDPLQLTRQIEMSAFVQNDVAVTRQIQVMMGVRYDVQTNLRDHNNVSPRLGLAYSVGGGAIVRGGVGLFHDRLFSDRVASQRRFDGTRQFEIVIDKPFFPDPFTGTIRQTFPSVRVTDPNLRAPRTLVAMASIEKTFWKTFLVTVTYDHQRTRQRFIFRDLNQPRDIREDVPQACTPSTPSDSCLRPDPTHGSVLNLESTSFQDTHALRANVRHRFSIFSITSSYTYQNGTEDNFEFGTASNAYDLRADWGPLGMPRHNMNASVNARLPLGVFVTQVINANSGRYYSITTGKDDNRDGVTNDRPEGVARNTTVGPSRINFDLNFSKAFFLGAAAASGSRKNVNVFVNVTNQFNRVHYNSPSGVMSSSNFGKFTSAADPREVEIGARFQF